MPSINNLDKSSNDEPLGSIEAIKYDLNEAYYLRTEFKDQVFESISDFDLQDGSEFLMYTIPQGLTEDQVNEIAKLPKGVAVVYQNDWVNPVLTMIDKAAVNDNDAYRVKTKATIMPVRKARTIIAKMLLQERISYAPIRDTELYNALKVLSLPRSDRNRISEIIKLFSASAGKLMWQPKSQLELQGLIKSVLGLTDNDCCSSKTEDSFRELVRSRMEPISNIVTERICYILTITKED